VFGSEGMVAGMGCQNLAFVGWHFPFFLFNYARIVSFFFGLRTTTKSMYFFLKSTYILRLSLGYFLFQQIDYPCYRVMNI
jgi:hypothetical protein